MKIINLYGGPGTGKSTTAAGMFNLLKLKGFKCEMSLEYAKDCTWEERHRIFDDQLYIFAKQHRRLLRLSYHKLDYVVTDAPLLLSLTYGTKEPESFNKLVLDKHNSFDNIDIFLKRVKPYAHYGRGQSEAEAKQLDIEILEMLQAHPYQTITADETAPTEIFKLL